MGRGAKRLPVDDDDDDDVGLNVLGCQMATCSTFFL